MEGKKKKYGAWSKAKKIKIKKFLLNMCKAETTFCCWNDLWDRITAKGGFQVNTINDDLHKKSVVLWAER